MASGRSAAVEFDAFVAWAGRAGGEPARVAQLSSVLLGGRGESGLRSLSVLNNDGWPLQVCLSYQRSGARFRLLGDPAATVEPPGVRFRLARRALAQVLRFTGSDTLREVCDQSLRVTLPRRMGTEPSHGAVWLAAGLHSGAAVYVNTKWGDPDERWRDAGHWLAALLPDQHASREIVAVVRRSCRLASVGVEGQGCADARLKLYWRLDASVGLAGMAIPLLLDDAFGAFLSAVVGERAVARQGVVLSAGFALSDGSLTDVKLDLCAHCLSRSPEEWVDVLKTCAPDARVCSSDLEHGLIDRQCEVAFVGLGIDRDRTQRVNVYLKPMAAVL